MLIHYSSPFLHNHPLISKSIKRSDFTIKKGIRINGAEKESEFETDEDKAREALRKLDEQLQSLSTKQPTTPKIRAVDMSRSPSFEGIEENSEISGSFWAYAVSFLFVFTIVYNVVFATIIKPSIDGEEPIQSTEIIE
ncbi:uncharacterized protein LOC125216680 [Salvia hispanica]|uniref:uncharacterized protein LOC125197950 n=1 Tax=Salvia hispanica TaxID=49212 RepID=UPI00200996FA|nr:uncharacterized protein LOC125197950 [Salvia hispanica]XP_047974395.1 uncharacterized protein LOC125216680 [Salvia hispanica]